MINRKEIQTFFFYSPSSFLTDFPAHLPLERLVFGGPSLHNLQEKGLVPFARESVMKQ